MEGQEIIKEFRDDFYSMVSQIPEGRVTTYGALAESLGDKIAARAVGKMLNQNPNPIEVPCHRVVRSNGELGGFGMGESKKKELLNSEGIEIEDRQVLDFEEKLFADFDSDRPLEELRAIQHKIRKKVSLENLENEPDLIAGVDVSYSHPEAYAALSLWSEGEEIDVFTVEVEMTFPYIPTYLAFREVPCFLEVLKKVEPAPDVILVDGNGVMHPKRAGSASHLGVEADLPTIGVAKSQLCGRVISDVTRENRVAEVRDDGGLMGYAVLEGNKAKNPIYVSPGHHVAYEKAVRIVRDYCKHKIPEPIRKAHKEAQKRRKKDG
ncbi:MAG: endonuclease V [Candidatus Natronoplasma sp.]